MVIPKAMRDRLHLAPGDEVEFELEENSVRVEPVKNTDSLKGRFSGRGLTTVLEAEHRKERGR